MNPDRPALRPRRILPPLHGPPRRLLHQRDQHLRWRQRDRGWAGAWRHRHAAVGAPAFTVNCHVAAGPRRRLRPADHEPLRSHLRGVGGWVPSPLPRPSSGSGPHGHAPRTPGTAHTHLLSAMLIAPFIATNLGLLRYNWCAAVPPPPPLSAAGRRPTPRACVPLPLQVPRLRVCRRHVLLLCGHDLCGGGGHRPLLQVAVALPHSPAAQFPRLRPAAAAQALSRVGARALPPAPPASVRANA